MQMAMRTASLMLTPISKATTQLDEHLHLRGSLTISLPAHAFIHTRKQDLEATPSLLLQVLPFVSKLASSLSTPNLLPPRTATLAVS